MRTLFGIFPLLIIPVAIYNLLGLTYGGGPADAAIVANGAPIIDLLATPLLTFPMISGVNWAISKGILPPWRRLSARRSFRASLRAQDVRHAVRCRALRPVAAATEIRRMIAVAHRTGRRDLCLNRLCSAMAFAAARQSGHQQVGGAVRLVRGVASGAVFLLMRFVIEPRIEEIVAVLEDRHDAPVSGRDVAFAADALIR